VQVESGGRAYVSSPGFKMYSRFMLREGPGDSHPKSVSREGCG
jgi:hypothetical protein